MHTLRFIPIAIMMSNLAWADEFEFPVKGGVLNMRTELTANTTFTTDTSSFADSDIVHVVTPTGRRAAEALIRGPAFASALAEANGNLEVGVNSFREGVSTATSTFDKFLTNNSPDPVFLGFEFLIPAGEFLLVDFSNATFQLPDGPHGAVLATIEFGIGSDPLQEIFAFGAGAHVDHGVTVITAEEGPIVARTVAATHSGEHRVKIDEFKGRVVFPPLPPGETLHFAYTMNVFGSNGIIEYGYALNLGDPLDLFAGGGSGEVVLVAPDASVPEPASFLLAGVGLVALTLIHRRKPPAQKRV